MRDDHGQFLNHANILLSDCSEQVHVGRNQTITLLFLLPFFTSSDKRSKTFSTYTIDIFLSNFVHICVMEHFFAKIIHPPGVWYIKMLIKQYD